MKIKKSFLKNIGALLGIAACAITSAYFVILALAAFMSTATVKSMDEQVMLYSFDNPLLHVPAFLAALFAILFLSKRIARNDKSVSKLFAFSLIWNMLVGTALIFYGKSMPGGDPYVVYAMGESAASGDLSFFCANGSYMSYYPQQIGLTTFFALLFKILKYNPISADKIHFVKVLYCLLNCASLTFQYKLVKNLFKNNRVSAVFLLLSLFNMPFMMYSSFVYGEIPSFAAMMGGIWYFYKMTEKKENKILNMCLSAILLALSVFLRKNSLIMIIAVLIVTLIKFLYTKKEILLLYLVLVAVLSFSILPMTIKVYEKITGNTILSGVTAKSYVAMGMQEGTGGPGWYNGFNFNTYEAAGMNAEIANRISEEAIKERAEVFKNNPSYAAQFYKKKFLSQWTDPTFASCQATWADCGNRAAFVYEIYNGKYNKYYVLFCNVFQNLIYVGAALYGIRRILCLKKIGKSKDFSLEYLFPIAIFGGFLFHMIWEANSRYIFLYGMMLVPYAAVGFAGTFGKKNKDKSQNA